MRFGLVGTGHWARETHAAAISAHPDATLAGFWGRSAARTAELASNFGAVAYPDLDALLDDVDAVAIAVPPDVQAPIAVRAARRGRHLLLDKPLALATADADLVVDAVASAGVRSLVFFTLRFTDNIAAWLADSQKADVWVSAEVRMLANIYQPGNPYGRSAWRKDRGALWDIGPHALSVILPLLGPIERVIAERGSGDGVSLLIHHSGRATSTLTLRLDSPPGSLGSSWRVYGINGQTSMPEPAISPLAAMGNCITALVTDPGAGSWAHPCDVRFGRDVVAVLAAAAGFLSRDPALRAAHVEQQR
jgi:predicted dehydrogenase